MGDFDLFTNEHVRNYFELKRSGQYEKALKELQIACNQEDGQGLYIMGEHVYATTGDLVISGKFFRRSANTKCPWGMFMHGFQNCTDRKEKNKWYIQAYETGDKFIMGKCLYFGSYAILRNRQLGIEYYLQACRENNPFVFDFVLNCYEIPENEYGQLVKQGAYLGVPLCLVMMGSRESDPKKKFEWYLKGHLQKYKISTNRLAECYYDGTGCKLNEAKGAKLLIESGNDVDIHSRMRKSVNLKEMFIFGREFKRNVMLRNNIKCYCGGDSTRVNTMISIYEESINKTQQAVFCFLLCTKQILIKDVRLLIGRKIWKFRKDPEI